MSVVVITPPAAAVSLEDAKAHLRVDGDDEDTLIEGLVAAATGHIDGPAGWLGRSLGEQVLELRLDAFPPCPIDLPYGPVSEILSVKYDDADGQEQTAGVGLYKLTADNRLRLAYGQTWPTARADAEAVRIQYRAGAADLPPAIKSAILLMVGDLYANREAQVIANGVTAAVANPAVANLLSPFRVWSA